MKTNSVVWSPLVWFIVHLAAIYVSVNVFVPELARWVNRTVFPLLNIPSSASGLVFLYAHLFTFSFFSTFVLGLCAGKFKPRIAEFVWVVPAVILAYRLLTFSSSPSSVLVQRESLSALHYYFSSLFVTMNAGEYVWNSSNPSPNFVPQLLAQLRYTAPFYAGIAYSLASWLRTRIKLNARVTEGVSRWNEQLLKKWNRQARG